MKQEHLTNCTPDNCCEQCRGSGSFNHTIGSHSDDRGGDSDLPCNCTENDCFHLATDKKPCECHIPQPNDQLYCSHTDGTSTHKIEDCPSPTAIANSISSTLAEPTEKECDCKNTFEGVCYHGILSNNCCKKCAVSPGIEINCFECTCHNLSLPPESSNWMEEEIEAFIKNCWQKLSTEFMAKEIADYWLSRMAEKIEEVKKSMEEESDELSHKCNELESQVSVAYEQGRHEEKERIVKMIEGKYASQIHQKDCEYQREGCDCGYMERLSYNHALDDLLANLKSNE